MLIDLNMNPSPQVASSYRKTDPSSSLAGLESLEPPDCFLRARESVRRASGFVQTGFEEVSQIGTAKSARLETKSWMLGRLPVRISVRPLLDDRFGAVHAN